MYQQVYDPVAGLAWAHLTIRRHSAYPHVCHVGRFWCEARVAHIRRQISPR